VDNKRLILYILALLVLGPMLVAPLVTTLLPHPNSAPVGTVNGPNIVATNTFGGSNIQVMSILCAGKIALVQGNATVNDACFTGDSNIVICSDVSAANPSRCQPGKGSLTIEGHTTDVIAYARVK
jgi:hypothetical protein